MAETKKDDPKPEAKAVDPLKPKTNETVPGGRYIKDGVAVNCWGEPLPDKATPEELRENPPAPIPPGQGM